MPITEMIMNWAMILLGISGGDNNSVKHNLHVILVYKIANTILIVQFDEV